MTENKNVETLAMLVRQSEKVRADFCKDVGITLDEYYVKQNGDFEIEDMVRAFQKGFGMALIPLQSQLTKKDKRIAELEAEVTRLRNENLDIINKYTRFAETDRRTIAELEAQIEKLIDFVLSKTECCDVCPITDTCINSEGTCPYAGILAKGEEEVTREWLMQFISKEIKEK